MGNIQREVLGSMKHHTHMYHKLNTLSHTFKGTENQKEYLSSAYLFLSLSQFPLLHKICLLPITFPNRSLYYSRNCQGKQTTKMASLFPNREATELVLMKAWSDRVSLVNFFLFPVQGSGLLVADMTGEAKG